ncbi:DNA-directed RNA polymerase I subunit RPA12 [Blastocystis sp. subtype 4]|uniref:DNA-directed RNA polymerase I subunit RPA12 n=1 Tax=Blastocystis sp. subtype 4 TaxID=944170 RepID=UPI0007113146|nr:DNA-directed RNA polymerase I subunit RPA12 [Blastocystis sp. subtype 4]KNB44735.1 DNA-directed RNA polymerase I subunit RPA12 [Blastocystis sp. subtype 4]|eukprot:XP_014528178.1 DNA-directed RNA polymerase I subunit RPA12 [Blastocystis sp. subtype 4]
MSKFVENFEKKSIRVNNVEFCRVCGSILDIPESGNIECGICHWTCHLSVDLNLFLYHWLRELQQKEDVQTGPTRAMVDEECPRCKNPQMSFYTLQLRSVDEGSTVFYKCLKCG